VARITISVEIIEAEFRQEYSVDPTAPLTELVRRISEEEGFPLRTKSGRPIAWTAEGPSWRPGKTELTDLVRTQSLEKIAQRFLDEETQQTPLFSIVLDIPGAADAIGTRRQEDKLASIDETLGQRKKERIDAMGKGDDFTMDTAERAVLPEPPPAPPPKPVESRIRRAPTKPRRPPPKQASGPNKTLLIGLGGGGCVLFLLVALVAAILLKPEPPPPVEPAPVEAAPVPVAVPVAPPPPPKVVEATPPPLKTFFHKGHITRSAAPQAGAQLSSFGKERISLSYTVRQSGSGSHTVSLKGRFSVTITDSGGRIEVEGRGGHPISKGAVVGKDTRVNISNLNGAVSVKVGGKRYGPYKVKKSSSFPAWKISIKSGATLENMKASSREQ